MDETVGLPGSNADYPSQDWVDRHGHFALIVSSGLALPPHVPIDSKAKWERLGALSQELPGELSRSVTEAVREVTSLDLFPRPAALRYHIGPGSESGMVNVVVTLAERMEDIPPSFDLIANTWAIAEIVRRVHAKVRAWVCRWGTAWTRASSSPRSS